MKRRLAVLAVILSLPLTALSKNRLKVDGITGASRKGKKRAAKGSKPASEKPDAAGQKTKDAVSSASRGTGQKKAPLGNP